MTTITFLGTSAVTPAAGHDTASFLINGKYLVDTGWYAAVKMLSYGHSPTGIDCVFITHCHHDHYVGLPHMLFYRGMKDEQAPLGIVGPAEDIERVVELTQQFLQTERFPSAGVPVSVTPLAPGEKFETADLAVTTCRSRHPVQGLVYRFTSRDGTASFAITGDTAFGPEIVEHVSGVDLLITEASYGAEPAPADNPWGHSGAPEAAQLAKQAGVGRLALVHCKEEEQVASLAAAREIFPATFWPDDGQTVVLE